MTHHLIQISLKIVQSELRDNNHLWLEFDLCKCTLSLKLVSRISFNPVVRLMLMNYHFDHYDLKIHFMKSI